MHTFYFDDRRNFLWLLYFELSLLLVSRGLEFAENVL